MNHHAREQWEECLGIIRNNVDPDVYKALFAFTTFGCYADGILELCVPSQFVFENLEKPRTADLIQKTIKRVFQENVTLRYRVADVRDPKTEVVQTSAGRGMVVDGTPVRPANQAPDALMAPRVDELASQLHPGYEFVNYYEGESNRLARSVGEAIAQRPATTFNPLFVYGPSGCGKTHLVNAIGWRIKELHPELRVLYLSAQLFTVQYQDAVIRNKTTDLIAFYQTIDVLIIDDIQEFSGKTKTQNTFFHIFNHLHQLKKQIILTADRPPVMIQDLEDRLLTRFKWGLQAEIDKPTKALRYKILLERVKRDGLSIPDNVLSYIAEKLDESVRDLEGIIVSLMAYSLTSRCEIDINLVNKLLPRYINKPVSESTISIEEVRRKVCEYFNMKEEVMVSKSRKAEIVYVRQLAIYLASEHTKLSNIQIGLNIGGRNHATVIHSIKQVKNLLEVDEKARQDIESIEAML